MLSIGAMGSGQGTYYVGLAREDYYLEGGEPPGQWVGQGSTDLGLAGVVERDQFLNLFAGVDKDGAPLVQNAGDAKRQPGWDLTFSAPKSVSTLWAVADEGTRRAIQDAHFEAVKSALKTMEEIAITRRGKGGHIKEAARLVIATFEHGTSRAQDPHLHTHCIVLNLAVRADGTTGALESQQFFHWKMAVGALYQCEFARQLQNMGWEVESQKVAFRLPLVPEPLTDEFSKRRAEIEARLEVSGKTSARAAAFAALDTREVKEHIARDTLTSSWRTVGEEYGFTAQTAEQGRDHRPASQTTAERAEELRASVAGAIQTITEKQAHFGARDLLRAVAEAAKERNWGADEVRSAVNNALKGDLNEGTELIPVGDHKGEARYTTRELWELEKSLLHNAEAWSGEKRHQTTQQSFLKGMLEAERRATQSARQSDPGAVAPTLSDEQRAALSHLTRESGGVALLSGMAGTGKTFLLDAAREAWEAQGFTVKGAAIAGKAARGLQEGAGIESTTIARLLFPDAPVKLDERTVLVIDEAGMVGTRQMAALVKAAQSSGAKLVLVGDAGQLQPIEVGGPFAALQNRMGGGQLQGIVRQRDAWARQAVKDFAAGHADRALGAFNERGLLTVGGDREEAKAALIDAWKTEGIQAPQHNVIFAGTRAEARDLNRRAQTERHRAGALGFRALQVEGETLHEKDRVLFTRNSLVLGVQNGTTGRVMDVDTAGQTLTIRLDNGRETQVPVNEYPHLTLGYALTTHKGQGLTTRHAFVLCGGAMTDRELSYVQASRATHRTQFFTERIEEWNPQTQQREEATLCELGRRMSQSRQKDLAHDVGHNVSEFRVPTAGTQPTREREPLALEL